MQHKPLYCCFSEGRGQRHVSSTWRCCLVSDPFSASVLPSPAPPRPAVGAYALEQHLQLRCSSSPTRSLLILFVEIDYWERLLFETPHYVVNVAERAEELRVLRENLLLVARDYNK